MGTAAVTGNDQVAGGGSFAAQDIESLEGLAVEIADRAFDRAEEQAKHVLLEPHRTGSSQWPNFSAGTSVPAPPAVCGRLSLPIWKRALPGGPCLLIRPTKCNGPWG